MWHLHNGRESCDVGLKRDLFRGIWLSEQFLIIIIIIIIFNISIARFTIEDQKRFTKNIYILK